MEVACKWNSLLFQLKTQYAHWERTTESSHCREDACLGYDKQESVIQTADRCIWSSENSHQNRPLWTDAFLVEYLLWKSKREDQIIQGMQNGFVVAQRNKTIWDCEISYVRAEIRQRGTVMFSSHRGSTCIEKQRQKRSITSIWNAFRFMSWLTSFYLTQISLLHMSCFFLFIAMHL